MVPLVVAAGFGVAYLLSWGLNWLALIPWRRSVGLHWTARARMLYPIRRAARVNPFLLTAGIWGLNWTLAPGMDLASMILPALFGALLGNFFLNREVYPELRFGSWALFVLVVMLLVYGAWFTVLVGGIFMPHHFGPWTWAIGATTLTAMIALQLGPRSLLLARLGMFHLAPARLKAIVDEMSLRLRTPVRNTWTVQAPMSNAAALPVSRELIFTEKFLSSHPDDEIRAVCAHELGHLNEPRRILLARVAMVFSAFPLVFTKPVSQTFGPTSLVWLWLPIPILMLVVIRVSRQMEKRADRIAVEEQTDKAVYARALERLYETNSMPAVMPRRSLKIHPDLYDRMLAAGITPDFPKPEPPKGQCWTTFAVVLAILAPGTLGFAYHFSWVIQNALGIKPGF